MKLKKIFSVPLVALLVLSGCGSEAPPCNDKLVTSQVLQMVRGAHNAHLNGYSKIDSLVDLNLELPVVVTYDEKLKIRKCSATFIVQAPPETVAAMNRYIPVVKNQENDDLTAVKNLLRAIAGQKESSPEFTIAERSDVAQWVNFQGEPNADKSVRKPIEYKVQKEEGTSDWITSTNVDVVGSIQYLRVADRAKKLFATEATQVPTSKSSTTANPVEAKAAEPVAENTQTAKTVQPTAIVKQPPLEEKNEEQLTEQEPEVTASATTPKQIDQLNQSFAKPSFNCAKASSVIESLICADLKLANLDAELGVAYKKSARESANSSSLKTEQLDWLREKRNKCTTTDCLVSAYKSRLADLAQK